MKNILVKTLLFFLLISCSEKDTENNTANLDSIKYGTSFGFCYGYCNEYLNITNSKIIFNKESWGDNTLFPKVEKTIDIDLNDWELLNNKINFKNFSTLQETIGCPDCADGGAEWIEIQSGERTHKITFEYQNEPAAVKEYISILRNRISIISKSHSFQESLNTWNTLKTNKGNSYKYTIEFVSYIGFGNRTEIEVDNGKVISRKYEDFLTEGAMIKPALTMYTETENELGLHTKGAPIKTIDELYETCIGEYLIVDANTNYISFLTNDVGILSDCGYSQKNCADDCFVGVSISNFEWISKH